MVNETVKLQKEGTATIEIKMAFSGLIEAEYTAKLMLFLNRIKEESGIFPDAEPDIFKLPGEEKTNINRRFELNTTLGAADPANFPDWSISLDIIRKGTPDTTIKTISDEGKFTGNLADSKIVVHFSS
jgi:hypothetical protein